MMFRDEYKNEMDSIRADGYIKQKVLNKIKAEQGEKRMKKASIYRIGAAVAACFALAVSVWMINSENKPQDKVQVKTDYDEIYNAVMKFEPQEPTLYDKVTDFAASVFGGGLKGNSNAEILYEYDYVTDDAMDIGAQNGAVEESENTSATGGKDDYSDTIAQVEGVHEADIVKTDGKYIYSFSTSAREIRIIKAGRNPELLSKIAFRSDKFMSNSDMYLAGDKLVIIGYDDSKGYENIETVALVYSVKNPEKAEKLYELRQSGNYHTSRLIGDKLYLVSDYSVGFKEIDKERPETYVPAIECEDYNGAVKAETLSINKVCTGPEYTVICGFSISDGSLVSTQSLLGGIYTLYCSTDNIIVAGISENSKTAVSRYSIDDGKIEYKATGEIDGNLLNQFSIDEYKGNFRFVTTVSGGVETRDGEVVSYKYTQSNALLVLDGNLKEIGAIKNIAPDERVYSVRFMGDVAYFVTFRQVDPLFSVDLKDPKNPRIIGALKIPGFSNYLYPFGEGKLLGIGQDADEYTGRTGGVKLSMFDTSDPANVTESAKMILDYNYSDALSNHKATLVEYGKNLIGFSAYGNKGTDYCIFSFENGFFRQMAEIKLGGVYEQVRGLYINQEFYVITNENVTVYDLETFTEIAKLKIK